MNHWIQPNHYLFPLFLLLLAVVSGAAQTTIHVPADVATIQGAIDIAQNGDTVLVAPGIYNENLDFKGKNIVVTTGAKSYNDATTTILNGTKDGSVVTFQSGESSAAVLNGFTIQNGHTNATWQSPGGGIVINNASPTITNNIVTRNYGCGVMIVNSSSPLLQQNDIIGNLYAGSNQSGMLCRSSSTLGGVAGTGVFIGSAADVKIIDSVIENNSTNPAGDVGNPTGAGIWVIGANSLLLQGNIIRNNYTSQQSAFSQQLGVPVKNLILINNLFYGNSSRNPSSAQILITGTYTGTPPMLTEVNNTIYGGGQENVLHFASSTIANNVFVNSTNVGFAGQNAGLFCADPETQTSPIDIRNNDIFNIGTLISGDCNFGAGNLAVDPDLLDPANGDFHEQKTSLLIAAGDIAAPLIPSEDLDRKARSVCNTIDMGAYELRPHSPIVLTSSSNPAPGGSSLTFTAQLTGNCNVPTGVLTFLDGGVNIGSGILNGSGAATITTSLLVVGTHNITATYPGDFNFESSTSDPFVQTITGDPTSTSFSATPNPASAFSKITLQSQVTSAYGTPTGSVEFLAGASVVATAPLDGAGRAMAAISVLGAGSYPMSAHYTADTRFQPSTSASVQEQVISDNTTTTLTTNLNPAAVTQTIVFAVVVHAEQGSTRVPTGIVTLLNEDTVLATAQLNPNGVATFKVASLSFGSHPIIARYEGSQDLNPSSATLTESVTLIGTTLALAATPNPADTGQDVRISATATSLFPGIVPFGTITFNDGSTVLGTSLLDNNGTATLTTSALAIGIHPLSATLATGSSLSGSSSSVFNEVVQNYDFALQPEKTAISLPSGDWTVLPVTVTPIGGFKGMVQLSCGNLPDHAQCIFPDGNSISLAAGAKTIRLSLNTSDVYGYGRQIGEITTTSGSGRFAAIFFPSLSLLCFVRRRIRSLDAKCKRLLLVPCLLGMFVGAQGCAGKLPGKTTPGAYAIPLTGTSGSNLQHVAILRLSVTP